MCCAAVTNCIYNSYFTWDYIWIRLTVTRCTETISTHMFNACDDILKGLSISLPVVSFMSKAKLIRSFVLVTYPVHLIPRSQPIPPPRYGHFWWQCCEDSETALKALMMLESIRMLRAMKIMRNKDDFVKMWWNRCRNMPKQNPWQAREFTCRVQEDHSIS